MFYVRCGFLFLTVFSGGIGVYSQMDVTLKGTTYVPLPHEGSSTSSDADIKSSDTPPEAKGPLKSHEGIQNDLKKIGIRIDPGINNRFDLFPHSLNPTIMDRIFNEHRQTQESRAMPSSYSISANSDDSDDDSSDEENPLVDFFKLVDDSMKNSPFGPRLSMGDDPMVRIGQKASIGGQGSDDVEPVGVLTIIRFDDDSPPQDNRIVPQRDDERTLANPEMESSLVQELVKSFMGAMKDMVGLVRNTSISLNGGENSNQNRTGPQIDILIKDHGRTYDIPHNAYIDRTNPDIVNITWRSELRNLNNSLSMNVSKDEEGAIVFHNIHLRMLNGEGLQEYNREDPVHMGRNKDNSTEINLADGVGLRFPHPDSLDVVVVEKRGKFSTQWMAVSIALLGLIVAGLIMLLSYILHSRNRNYARKDSMSKEPIA